MVAEGLKLILDTEEEREKFVAAVEVDAEFEATKVVLALKIDHATMHYNAKHYTLSDAEQESWRGVLDDMVECRFEGERGDQELVAAISSRMELPDAERTSPRVSIASALKHLRFVEIGL